MTPPPGSAWSATRARCTAGARLQQALTWADANPNLLSLDEQAFLDASQQGAGG